MLRVRELLNDDKALRIEEVEDGHDYPRPITLTERVDSWWFSYGPATFWLWPVDDDEIVLHLCIPEPFQGRLYAREWMVTIKVIGQLLGYKRIRFPGADDDLVASYLRRWGWTSDADGMYLDLGSLEHGKTTENSEGQVQSA